MANTSMCLPPSHYVSGRAQFKIQRSGTYLSQRSHYAVDPSRWHTHPRTSRGPDPRSLPHRHSSSASRFCRTDTWSCRPCSAPTYGSTEHACSGHTRRGTRSPTRRRSRSARRSRSGSRPLQACGCYPQRRRSPAQRLAVRWRRWTGALRSRGRAGRHAGMAHSGPAKEPGSVSLSIREFLCSRSAKSLRIRHACTGFPSQHAGMCTTAAWRW